MHERKLVTVGVVPARLGSTRLPEKMMADIHGKPLIVWTAEAALASRAFDRVVVATDHERIVMAVRSAGFEAMMTDPALSSGTARVAEVAHRIEADVFVNVQGDEPLVDRSGLQRVVETFKNAEVEIATLSFPLRPDDENNPNVVKVVTDRNGDALYFSRSCLPFPRSREKFSPLKHIGVYGYRKETLFRLMSLEPCALEQVESLEQLRALYHGIKIRVLPAEKDSIGVDTRQDLDRVKACLERR